MSPSLPAKQLDVDGNGRQWLGLQYLRAGKGACVQPRYGQGKTRYQGSQEATCFNAQGKEGSKGREEKRKICGSSSDYSLIAQ